MYKNSAPRHRRATDGENERKSVTGDDERVGKKKNRTKGTPGIISDVIKVARTLLCTPLSKLGQRNTSKLLVPNKCFGSTAPVFGFIISLSTNI